MGVFRLLFCVLLVVVNGGIGNLEAAEFEWLPGGTYEDSIPTPESVLGYEIGTYLTDHNQMIRYIHELAEASDRVQLLKYGQSTEKRDMYLVFIGSPENLGRLEEIRSSIDKLTDPRQITQGEAEALITETPPIGWMNFGVDGGETAAFETAMLLAYQLAAGNDPLTSKIVENIVTIINPAANPDSHQTFTTWMKASTIGKRGTADPFAAEHRVPWFISSDGNHFLIDFNRDAFALTQMETQALAKVLHHWVPQIWIDNHGEPNEYYFAPFVSPMNLNYPQDLRDRAIQIGRNTAKHFDQFGWTYVKDETFDLFYPGYWDSYPAFNGSVSATYETNGGGWKNLVWEKPDGTEATLRGAIHAHFTADLATLEVLADNPAQYLQYFYDFFHEGIEEADQAAFKTYILLSEPDAGRTARLVETLLRHKIEVFHVSKPINLQTSQTYFDREEKARLLPSGSYLIPMKQPRKRFIQALLEPDPGLEQEFLTEIDEARRRNGKLGTDVPKERAGFYDVTAWALPLTFGVECVFTSETLDWNGMERVSSPVVQPGSVEGGEARYAYVFANNLDSNAKLAGLLLQEGYRVALGTSSFKNSGKDFPAGTFIARVNRNPATLHSRIQDLSVKSGAKVTALNTAWAEEGISLGSRRIVDLVKPRIAVMSNEPTRAVAFGAVRTLLEQRFELDFTALRADYFDEVDLSRYNVIVFPDGFPSEYLQLLGDKGLQGLKNWINTGGVVIGFKGGAEFFTLDEVSLADIDLVNEVAGPEEEGTKDSPVSIEYHPGSIFRVEVNTDYYLAFGYPETVAVQVRGDTFFLPSEKGANVATFPKPSLIQGHKWEYTEDVLSGKVYFADIPVGDGHVIVFADDPTFRAYWQGLDRFVMNSILLAPAF